MEDVTARIVIAAEAGKSLKEISQVENGLNKIYDSRQKDLMLAQAKAKLELAEYKSMTAAQAAYNAEIHKEGALKRLNFRKSRGADADEIAELTKQYQALHGQYLKLAQAESTANLAAYNSKVQYDNLSQSLNNISSKTENAGKKIKDLTGRISASRAASRLFGLDIDNGMNPALLKAGIIAAGTAASIKLLTYIYDSNSERLKYLGDIEKNNTLSLKANLKERQNLFNSIKESISILSDLQDKERLSNIEKLNSKNIIEGLEKQYGRLGFSIDDATGKILNFDEANKKLSRTLIEREKKDIRRSLAQLAAERDRQFDIINQKPLLTFKSGKGINFNGSLNPFDWDFNAALPERSITTPSQLSAIKEASKRLQEINDETMALRKRFFELKKLNPEETIDKISAAKRADKNEKEQRQQIKNQDELNKKFSKELEDYKARVEYQKLLNSGREKEAELLMFNLRLARQGYSEEQKNKLVGEFSKEYDLRNQRKNDQTPASQRIASNLMGKIMTFQETAQSAVLSNSVDAIRLQSRMLFNNANNPQVKLVEQGKRSVSLLERMDRTLTNMSRGGSTLSLKTV